MNAGSLLNAGVLSLAQVLINAGGIYQKSIDIWFYDRSTTSKLTLCQAGRWVTMHYRLFDIVTGSLVCGTAILIPLAGLLCEYGFDGGWPSVFYVFGSSNFFLIPLRCTRNSLCYIIQDRSRSRNIQSKTYFLVGRYRLVRNTERNK